MSRLYSRAFLIAFLSQTGFVLANTLMAHYARWIDFLGGGVSDVGWIMGVGSIAGLLMRPWIGQWINRWGARKMWAIGYCIFAIAILGNLLLHELNWLMLVLRSLLVFGAALNFSSSLTYITQISPIDRRTEAIGSLGVGGFMGMLAGPYLGDLILGAGDRTREDFTILFVTAAGAVIVPALLLLMLPKPQYEQRSRAVGLKDFVRTVRQYWPGMILLVNCVFGLCMTVPFVFLSKYIDEVGLSINGVSEIGLFFWCYSGIGLSFRIGLRRLPERVGRRKVLLAGMLVMGTGMLCYLLVTPANALMLVVPALICGTGHGLMFHTGTSLLLEPIPNEFRGTGSALSLMMLDFGMICGAPVLGHIADTFGYDWLFITVGTSCIAVAGLYAYSSVPVWRARKIESAAQVAAPESIP